MQIVGKIWFVHKYEVSQEYGGPEEGGWWYDTGTPVEDWETLAFTDEEEAYERCRELNDYEYERQEREEHYNYTSVLSYRSTHFGYVVSDEQQAKPFPERRPHYE